MKKYIFVATFLGMSGLLFAATKQPIGNGPSVLTSAQINAATPAYAGQPVICSDCMNANAAKYNICISSAGRASTSVGAFVLISSATAITACR